MADETEIQRLLRLKRYEQPPPEFFDSFLNEFHRRQRSEMLRQPLWRIAADRVSAFFSEHSVPRYGYATATAMVLCAGILAGARILSPRGAESPFLTNTGSGRAPSIVATSNLALDGRISPAISVAQPSPRSMDGRGSLQPRYVIDARPVSYEPASSF